MFCDDVVVIDFSDHLDVELLFALGEFGLEYDVEIVSVLVLEGYSLGKSWHLSGREVDSALDLARAIREEEHVGIIFPPEILQSANYRNCVEALPIKNRILRKLVVDLIEG